MASDRVERRLLVVKLDPDRALARAAGGDLRDRRRVGFAQMLLDVEPLLVPLDDVPQIGKCDPRVFPQHPLGGDAEPRGAYRDILEARSLLGRLKRLVLRGREVADDAARSRPGTEPSVSELPQLLL